MKFAKAFISVRSSWIPPIWVALIFAVVPLRSQTSTVTNQAPVDLSDYHPGVMELAYGATPDFPGRIFNIFLGMQSPLGPENLIGSTTSNRWTLRNLNPNQTYYWKVEAVDGEERVSGPTWQFTTAPLGPLGHFEWELFGPHYTNRPSLARIRAADKYRHTIPNYSEPLAIIATGGGLVQPQIVISEVSLRARSFELMNVSSANINLTGWKVTVYDTKSWPNPLRTLTLPSATAPAGVPFSVRGSLGSPGNFPIFNLGATISWGGLPSSPAAVLVQNPEGDIVDFVWIGGGAIDQIIAPQPIPITQWAGNAVRSSFLLESFHRVGSSDSNDASDWKVGLTGVGVQNPAISTTFQAGRGELPVSPSIVSSFSDGVAEISFQLGAANDAVQLIVKDDDRHWGLSERFLVRPAPPLTLLLPESVREGTAFASTGRVVLPEILTKDLAVTLSVTDPTQILLPSSIVIPAGEVEGFFEIRANNDQHLEGTELVQVSASAENHDDATASMTIYDRQTAELSLVLPASLREDGSSVEATLIVSSPVAKAIDVTISVSLANHLEIPARVRIEQNESRANFNINTIKDQLLEGNVEVEVTASFDVWGTGSGSVVVLDDELPELKLLVPPEFDEGAGTRTNIARLTTGGVLLSNLVVQLSSSDPASLTVPETVTIPAGQSNVVLNVTLIENAIPQEFSRPVAITASHEGFTEARTLTAVLDNDPVEIKFAPIPSAQYTNRPINLVLSAYGMDGKLQANFKGSVTLEAFNSNGIVAIQNNAAGPFVDGVWSGSTRILDPAQLIQLRSTSIPGESEPFHVETPAIRIMPFLPTDLVLDSRTRTLYATTLANNPDFPQKIVAIDPVTLQATNTYAVSVEPYKVEVAPQGGFAYVLSTDRRTFERFNFATRTTSTKLTLRPNWVAKDFVVVGGASDSIVVRQVDSLQATVAEIWRYDNNVGKRIDALSEIDTDFLETDANGDIWGYQPRKSYTLARVDFGAVNEVLRGGDFWLRSGVLYDDLGYAADASTLQFRGVYPIRKTFGETGVVEVDPTINRTFYITAQFWGQVFNPRIMAFDTATFTQVTEFPLPGLSSPPLRFLCMDTNLMVFANHSGEIWFIESKQLQPVSPTDLAVEQRLGSSTTVIGQPASIRITLTNKGPRLATLVRVSNTLPEGAKLLSNSLSSGSVTATPYGFDWKISEFLSGQSATLTFSLSLSVGGQVTNAVAVVNYEGDLNFGNNVSNLPLDVALPSEGQTTFVLNYPCGDLLYDAAQDKLLVAVQEGIGTLPNGIGLIDPRTGEQSGFHALPEKPLLISRTAGGEYLYVSFKEAARVGRLHLPSFTQDIDFSVGEEISNGTVLPYYAAGIEPLPTDPHSIVAWQVRKAKPSEPDFARGLAVFKDGVAQPNGAQLYDNTGYSLTWDPETLDLFTFSHGEVPDGSVRDLKRYQVHSDGLLLRESYPPLDSTVGREIHFASGHLINSAGRNLALDPFGISGTFAGAEYSVATVVDTNSARIFFVTPAGEQKWTLTAYRFDTREPVGKLVLPDFTGTPTDLNLWSSNGLAFRASTNQIVIVRTDLRQPQREADLQITATASEENKIIITVLNRGPAEAQEVVVTNQFSSVIQIDSAETSTGTFSAATGLWSIGSLAAGAEADMQLTLRGEGVLTDTVTVSSGTVDPNLRNNTVQAALRFSNVNFVENPLVLTDLAWSSGLNRLLGVAAAGAGNWSGTLLTIDPEKLGIESEVFAGSGDAKLALTDDGSRLFIGSYNTVRSVSLPNFILERDIPLDTSGYLWSVGHLLALPGANDSFVVQRFAGPNGKLVLFRGAAAMSNTTEVFFAGSMALGKDGVLHYLAFDGTQFHRFTLSAEGLALLDNHRELFPFLSQLDLAWGDGKLIFSDGSCLNAATLANLGQFKNVPSSSKVYYDSKSERALFAFKDGNNAVFRAFDVSTQILLGEEKFPTTLGSPSNLVHWAQNGLAFRATNGFATFKTSMLPVGAPADLKLQVNPAESLATFGESFHYDVIISNTGTATAANLRLLAKFSAAAGELKMETAAETVSVVQNEANMIIGPLEAGAAARITIRTRPIAAGVIRGIIKVVSDAPDSDLANNTQQVETPIFRPFLRGSAFIVDDRAADVVYNSSSGRLYVSSLEGHVFTLGPTSTLREATWPVGGVPGLLALSSDNTQLWVGIGDGQRVERLNTDTGTRNLQLTPDMGVLHEIQPLPDRPHSAIISAYGGYPSIKVFDDDKPRRDFLYSILGPLSLEFSDSPQVVYGLADAVSQSARFYTFEVFENGIRNVVWSAIYEDRVGASHFADGLVYSDSGLIIDPNGPSVLTRLPELGKGAKVIPEPSIGRLICLVNSGSTRELRTYDIHTLGLLDTSPLPLTIGAPSRFIRWGGDGIAYTTTSNELVVARSSLLPDEPSADAAISLKWSGEPLAVGSVSVLTATITNQGPNDLTSSTLSLRFLPSAIFQGVEGLGNVNVSSNLFSSVIGALPVGGSATCHFYFRPTHGGPLEVVASLATLALDTNIEDNHARLSTNVQFALAPDQVANLYLPSTHFVYEPVSGMIYVVGSDKLAQTRGKIFSLDPRLGEVRTLVELSPGLSQASVADDGSRLHVIGGKGTQIYSVELPGGVLEREINRVPPSLKVAQIAAVPGSRNKLAVVFASELAGLYIDGELQTKTISGSWSLVFYSPTEALGWKAYGYPFKIFRVHIVSDGLQADSNEFPNFIGDKTVANSVIYTTGGSVIDPVAVAPVREYGVTGLVAPMPTLNRVAFLTETNLTLFEDVTTEFVGSIAKPSLTTPATQMIYAGGDRLALRNDSGEIVILRTSLIPHTPTDTDNDGLPDDWETVYRLSTTSPDDAMGDADNDSFSNLSEYLAGTHPRNSASVLRVQTSVSANALTLSFPCVRGRAYQLQSSPGIAGPWTTIQEIKAETDTVFSTEVPLNPASALIFYRVQLQ